MGDRPVGGAPSGGQKWGMGMGIAWQLLSLKRSLVPGKKQRQPSPAMGIDKANRANLFHTLWTIPDEMAMEMEMGLGMGNLCWAALDDGSLHERVGDETRQGGPEMWDKLGGVVESVQVRCQPSTQCTKNKQNCHGKYFTALRVKCPRCPQFPRQLTTPLRTLYRHSECLSKRYHMHKTLFLLPHTIIFKS